MYATLKKLRAGEVIELNGLRLKMDEGKLEEGDLYVAERNTEPQLLTVKEIVHPENLVLNAPWVVPTTFAYSYDLGESVKVTRA